MPRDLLPLPPLPADGVFGLRDRGRTTAQRVARRAAVARSTNELVWALNFLNGEGEFQGIRPSAAQVSSLEYLESCCRSDSPPSPLPEPKASLTEMLGNKAASYNDEAGPSSVASYRRDLVSWPASAGCLALESVLPERERLQLAADGQQLLLSADDLSRRRRDEGLPKSYWDPLLKDDKEAYAIFVNELAQRNMVTFRRSAVEEVGCFFVPKKSGKIRLVIDARRTNQRLISPPATKLASTAAVVEFHAQDGSELWFSSQDIADCYYQFALPEFMVGWFALRPICAGAVGLRAVQGSAVRDSDRVYPCLRVLPMGFSWALHWTQQAHRLLLHRSGLGGLEREWLDRGPPAVPEPGQPARLVYVDNELFIAGAPAESSSARRQAVATLTKVGLPLHEVEEECRICECVGLELDGVAMQARLSQRRRWRLRQAWLELKRRPVLSGAQLETLLGHYTHAMLLNRPALAIFRSCYDFCRASYYQPRKLWPSVYNELRAATALIPLYTARWTLPWCPYVNCSDATLNGYAVQESVWPVERVEELGTWSERWRFRLGAGLAPRQRAFVRGDPSESTEFDPDTLLRTSTAEKASADVAGMMDAFTLNPDFPEVPKRYLDEATWSLIQARRYHFREPVHLKEMRAVCFAFRRRVRQKRFHHMRHLFLCDNLGITLSLEKGRAANARVLRLNRQWAALALASGCRARTRWIPSEWNPSDEPSRWFDPGAGRRFFLTQVAADPERLVDGATIQAAVRDAGRELLQTDRRSCPGDKAAPHAAWNDLRGGACFAPDLGPGAWRERCTGSAAWAYAQPVAERALVREPAPVPPGLRGGGPTSSASRWQDIATARLRGRVPRPGWRSRSSSCPSRRTHSPVGERRGEASGPPGSEDLDSLGGTVDPRDGVCCPFDGERLPETLAVVRRLLRPGRPPRGRRHRAGAGDPGVLRRGVLERPPVRHGHEADRCAGLADGAPPPACPLRGPGAGTPGAARLGAPGSTGDSATSTLAGPVGTRLSPAAHGPVARGSRCDAGSRRLLEAWRTAGADRALGGAATSRVGGSFSVPVAGAVSPGGRRELQGRPLRRQRHPRLGRRPRVDRESHDAAEGVGGSGRAAPRRRGATPPASGCRSGSQGGSGVLGGDALCPQAYGSIARLPGPDTIAHGHQTSGPVDGRPEREALRKSQPGYGPTGPAAPGHLAVPAGRRPRVAAAARASCARLSRAHATRRGGTAHRPLRVPPAIGKTRLFLDIFSGCGRLSEYFRRRGWVAIEWDIRLGGSYDVLVPANAARLMSLVGRADWVHLGTPCTSFSTARRGRLGSPGGPLRSKLHPMGLPDLAPVDAEKVRIGNRLLRFSLKVVDACRARRIPVALENPRRSRLWWTPCMLQHLRRGATKVIVDFCQFGTPWQKPTTFAVWGSTALDRLDRRCSRVGGCCSRSLLPHQRLQGTAPGGRHWTAIAEPYPRGLCARYAALVEDSVVISDLRALHCVSGQAAPSPVRNATHGGRVGRMVAGDC